MIRKTPLRAKKGFKKTGWKRTFGNTLTNKRKPLRKRSKRREKDEREYSRLRLEFLQKNSYCTLCGRIATDIHHVRGRGKFYLDTATWIGLCRSCHGWVHDNPAEARKNDLLVYGKDGK